MLEWPGVHLEGTPFAATVGREICYLGSLWLPESSFSPQGNAVISSLQWYGADIVHIEPGWLRKAEDARDDPRILDALVRYGQYAGGLECSLDEVVLSQSEGSIAYTFTVRNADRDALYVLDPEKLPEGSFHWFTNGITLSGGHSTFSSSHRAADPSSSGNPMHVDPEWFTLLRRGDSMKRTLALGGYPAISPGSYQCSFGFPSPMKVPREDRRLSGGRIWLGAARAARTLEVPTE